MNSPTALQLHHYWRSSASYRVRIALNLKGLTYQTVPVHLVRDGGQQNFAEFVALNPNRTVPVLVDPAQAGAHASQSLAILEYLEERHPEPALLPADAVGRARVREFALTIACDLHPLTNLRVLNYLTGPLEHDEAAKTAWIHHWNQQGLAALEAMAQAALREWGGDAAFCFGDQPTFADCLLIPQLFNARRFGLDLTPYPRLLAIESTCLPLKAFVDAHPSRQPEAE